MKKQPDKITAYYYRAANKQTDLNLDNQMHRLLSHAQENESDTYMFFVDNGYSGLTAERPAFQNLLAAIHENRVQKCITALSTPTAVLPRKAVSADDGIYLSELEAAGQFKQ